jgi:predicted DCC family thiol-disulfide oxidoreductase YuxK
MQWLRPRPSSDGRHLLLYDGECGLCDRAVQFLLPRDRGRVLTFAPLQGSTAAALRSRLAVPRELDSLLLVLDAGSPGERLLTRSSAVLGSLDVIGGIWRLLSWLRLVPRPVRDAVYVFVAKRRAIWFGRLPACRVPTPAERDRFLD